MNIKRILLISRPALWYWLMLPYAMGMGAFANSSILSFIELILFTLPINFYLYGVNDIYDIRSDRINDRKGGVQGAILKPSEINFVKKLSGIFISLFLAVSVFSFNPEHILLSLIFAFLCFAYSSPKFRFKEKPFLDSFSAALIYVLPGFIAYSLTTSFTNMNFKYFILILPIIGAHAMSTLPDYEADKKTKMKTIGVFLGRKKTKFFSIIMFIIPFFAFFENLFLTSIFLTSICFHLISFRFEPKKEYDIVFFSCLVSLATMALIYGVLLNNF